MAHKDNMTIHFILQRNIFPMIRECFLPFKAFYSLNYLVVRGISYTVRSGHLRLLRKLDY